MVNATPGHFNPGKNRYPLYRRLGEPQGWSGRVRNFSLPKGFDPRNVRSLASRYTVRAIPASRKGLEFRKFWRPAETYRIVIKIRFPILYPVYYGRNLFCLQLNRHLMHYLPYAKSRSLINNQKRFDARCSHLGCYLFTMSHGVQHLSQHLLPKRVGVLVKQHNLLYEK